MSDRTKRQATHKDVLQANIDLHAATAATYSAEQPHYKKENVARVEKIIAGLAAETGGDGLLDLGCGAGFITDIARKKFRRVVGVDVTPQMLARVDRTGRGARRVALVLGETGALPLRDNSFDACTAYSFLHHLYDLRPTLSEAFRCLRPGGVFYADQDPNRGYWSLMERLRTANDLPERIAREVAAVCEVHETTAAEKDINPESVALAEFHRSESGGFDPEQLAALMRDVGFTDVRCRHEWFLGQGTIYHERSPREAKVIERFLREALPATADLFKYFTFFARKE